MSERVPYHPRQCHLCRYSGVNALLSERGLPLCEEAERACLACRDPGLPNDGVSWVHMDAAANPATVYAHRAAPDYAPNGRSRPREISGERAREGVLDLLRRFGEIPFGSADVVCGMLRGKTLAELSAETRQSIQSLHARWRRACEADPVWRAIENGMMGKGVGRKRGSGTKARTFDAEAKATPTQAEMGF